MACIFYVVGAYSDEPNNSWISNYEQEDQSLSIVYLDTIYYCITTMITIGYGDIHGYTSSERLFCVFLMLLATGIFSYTMNNIQLLIMGDDQTDKEL